MMVLRNTVLAALAVFWVMALGASAQAGEHAFDLVLAGGRVIDPETGLDGVRNVGIRAGQIAEISERELAGAEVIDVSGNIVAPGFIDIHTHSPTQLGQYHQIMDGTTTALELEAGSYPTEKYGESIRGAPLINFGTSAGYINIRARQKMGIELPHMASSPMPINALGVWTAIKTLFTEPREAFEEKADADERAAMRAMLEGAVEGGALGIGLALDYISEGVDAEELRMIFDVAAAHDTIIFVHIRRGINGDPAGLYEVLNLARTTGASLHICHIQHNAMRNTDLFLAEIAKARAEGLDVTTEILPYNAGSATISSAVFNRNWQEVFDITYSDVAWAATGERFTKETWEERKSSQPNGQVIHHYVKEDWTRRALAEPGVMIVTDLLPMVSEDKKVAPHNAAFTKILARYVRETPLLDMKTALAKMTLLPARRLENIAPAFKRKGRLQVGADADITVFNPDTVLDNASYANPYQTASGIALVVVNGVPVVRQGKLVEGVYPGREITAR